MSDAWTSAARSAPWPFARSGTLAALPRPHRPRESAFAKGVSALGSTELLAVVIGNGSATASAFDVAHRLVRRHGSQGAGALSPATSSASPAWASRSLHGSRPHSSSAGAPARARATSAFVSRVRGGLAADARSGTRQEGAPTRPLPRCPKRPDPPRDHLRRLAQHDSNAPARDPLPRDRAPRPGVHPGAQPSERLARPSDEDVAFTRGVHRAAETIGIELYDHLIVSGGGFHQPEERGHLNPWVDHAPAWGDEPIMGAGVPGVASRSPRAGARRPRSSRSGRCRRRRASRPRAC